MSEIVSESGTLFKMDFLSPVEGSGCLSDLLGPRLEPDLSHIRAANKLWNPTTPAEALAAAVLRGDKVAAMALVDKIQEEGLE